MCLPGALDQIPILYCQKMCLHNSVFIVNMEKQLY